MKSRTIIDYIGFGLLIFLLIVLGTGLGLITLNFIWSVMKFTAVG